MGIAKFEKVSFEQFRKDMLKFIVKLSGGVSDNTIIEEAFGISIEEEIRDMYDNIKLPKRATDGSAGYDFYMPCGMMVSTRYSDTFPTGIRCKMEKDWVLMLFPRSGHGFKYGSRLKNTVGIIDSDYYGADNEGHIHCKLLADSPYTLEAGESFMQGIFLQYGLTSDDDTEGVKRTGGFGSTDGTTV